MQDPSQFGTCCKSWLFLMFYDQQLYYVENQTCTLVGRHAGISCVIKWSLPLAFITLLSSWPTYYNIFQCEKKTWLVYEHLCTTLNHSFKLTLILFINYTVLFYSGIDLNMSREFYVFNNNFSNIVWIT